MCDTTNSYKKAASFYFLGFIVGCFTFFFPDMIGHRKTMLFILPFYTVASAMSIFSDDMSIKTLGFFLQGLFHLKISLSYLHVLDLIPDNSKSFVYAFITAVDSSTWMVACTAFQYYSNNEDKIFAIHFWIGFTACVIYFFFIPESPRWLFLAKGSNNQEAIRILNWISWFNGANLVIPSDAIFDTIGQVIEENETLNSTIIGRLDYKMNQTINRTSLLKE